ncbi:FecCD family ABC transporter permease [Nakamurella alba]|nr:iron chelate uptake ABC transporter family permease subunit [Nakamurella alba]
MVIGILLAVVAGLAIGTNPISPVRVLAGLFGDDPEARTVVIGNRMPRVVLAIVIGAALGLAGHLMQSLTRNPLADPGLLGIQAGASAAVVSAIAFFGITNPGGYAWFALVGAAAGALVGYGLAAVGRGSASPVRLILAGTAISGALYSYVSGVLIVQPFTFSAFRFWEIGSLTTRDLSVTGGVLWFVVPGILLALALAAPLNGLALGHETAIALGVRTVRTQVLALVAVVLLTGGATAAVGPVAFIGLAVPHLSRALVGPDHRKGLPMSILAGILMLQLADVVGRVIAWPQEIGAGIVAAVVGAPVLVYLVRTGKVGRL